MTSVSVTQFKNRLSHYLRLARSGTVVQILDHGAPVATVRGIGDAPEIDAFEKLVREGVLLPAQTGIDEVLAWTPHEVSADVVAILTEERDER